MQVVVFILQNEHKSGQRSFGSAVVKCQNKATLYCTLQYTSKAVAKKNCIKQKEFTVPHLEVPATSGGSMGRSVTSSVT